MSSILGKNIASSLKDALKDSSGYTSATPLLANQIIAKEITDHFLSKAELTVTYTGVITGVPPVPESCTDKVKVVGVCAPPIGASWDLWLSSLEINIKAGFLVSTGALVHPITPILSFNHPTPLASFIPQSRIKNAHESNLEEPQEKVWIEIADGIIEWLTSGLPVPFTYPAGMLGVGTAIITKIEIP